MYEHPTRSDEIRNEDIWDTLGVTFVMDKMWGEIEIVCICEEETCIHLVKEALEVDMDGFN